MNVKIRLIQTVGLIILLFSIFDWKLGSILSYVLNILGILIILVAESKIPTFTLPKRSEIRLLKLLLHSLLFMAIIQVLSDLVTVAVAYKLGHQIHINTNYVSNIVILWVFFFALRSKKYRKQDNDDVKNR